MSKNSLLCPNCRRLISRDEPSCPHCGLARPGSPWKNLLGGRLFPGPEQLVGLIVAANIAMYVLALLFNPGRAGMAMSPFRFLSPDNQSLLLLGASGTLPIDGLGRWWTLIAASYLHGGLLHIVFNMMALRQLGPLVLAEYGTARMITIYTLGGMAGFLLSYLAGIRFTIGASAAVCALIGATLYYGRSRGGVYGRELFRQVGGWAVGIFLFGLLVPGINNWAHGGGMAAGAALGFLLGYQENRRETLRHRMLAAGCALATVAVLLWAVGSGVMYRFLG